MPTNDKEYMREYMRRRRAAMKGNMSSYAKDDVKKTLPVKSKEQKQLKTSFFQPFFNYQEIGNILEIWSWIHSKHLIKKEWDETLRNFILKANNREVRK